MIRPIHDVKAPEEVVEPPSAGSDSRDPTGVGRDKDAGGIEVACHFFTAHQIEFDLRPEEVTGPERLAAVTSFLHDLATAIGKSAVLTMENVPEAVVLRATPSGSVVWVPPHDANAG